MSTRNPFRDSGEASIPGSSAASSSNYAAPPGPPPAQTTSKPTPQRTLSVGIPGAERDIPESDSSGSSRSPSPSTALRRDGPSPAHSGPSAAEIQEALRGESPPPYTPTADASHGETTIEFGPRRPWGQTQQPRLLSPSWQRPQRTGWQGLSAGLAGYPGALQRQSTGATWHVPPPPQHPMLSPHRTPSTSRSAFEQTVSPPPGAVSDFARDFYIAGSDDSGILGGGSSQYAPPPTALDGGSYAPPPGPQPYTAAATPPRTMNCDSSSGGLADDGRPTNKPVPGHPLMNAGKVLVYPAGYECSKCRNTGYKHLDPSNPCSKCWSKYAKAYAGPLTYASWSSRNLETSNFQRPLPALARSPASASASTHRSSSSLTNLPPPPQHPPQHPGLGRSASASRVAGYPGSSYAPQPTGIPTSNGGFLPTAPYLSPLHRGDMSPLSGPSTQYAPRPPPGAAVVPPGDPRIGGHLCWRCGGKGTTSFLIFDVETCGVCNGLGRTF